MSRNLDRVISELERLLEQQRAILKSPIDEDRASEYVTGTRRIRQLFNDMEAIFAHESREAGIQLPKVATGDDGDVAERRPR